MLLQTHASFHGWDRNFLSPQRCAFMFIAAGSVTAQDAWDSVDIPRPVPPRIITSRVTCADLNPPVDAIEFEYATTPKHGTPSQLTPFLRNRFWHTMENTEASMESFAFEEPSSNF